MSKFNFFYLALVAVALTFASCGDDEDVTPPNEEELITTVEYTLTSLNGDIVTMSFQDLDGDGSNGANITGGTLTANTTYNASILLLNENETPDENITLEVQEEDLEHQFFFSSTVPGLTINYADQDSEGNPLGILSTVTTGDAGSGVITIVLRHEPDKGASGVANGDITNAGGETDIEVSFDVTVQ